MLRTSRYRNSKALRAWLCVEVDTLRSVASMVRKASISGAPMPANEKSHPVQVNLLGAEATVHVPDALTQLVQQAG